MRTYKEFIFENKDDGFNSLVIKKLNEMVPKMEHRIDDGSYQIFRIETLYGGLDILIFNVCCTIFLQFMTPDIAVRSVPCNSLTGKWNIYGDDPVESVKELERRLKMVL